MRLDCNGENWHNAYMGRVHCYLNGDEVKHVVCADEEEGLVTSLKIGADGHFITCGDEIAEETHYGDVKIVFDEPPETLIRQYNALRKKGIRERWRSRLDLDRLPMPWEDFNRKAKAYAFAVNKRAA